MSITQKRRRKAIAGVMALTAAALFVDRVFLGSSMSGPDAAGGAEPSLVGSPNAKPTKLTRMDVGLGWRGRVASRLAEAKSRLGLKAEAAADGFEPSASWTGLQKPAGTRPAMPDKPADNSPLAGKQISAVLTTPSGKAVILEGEVVALGDVHAASNLKLTEILPNAAVFTGPGVRVEVPISSRGLERERSKVQVNPGTKGP